MLGLKKISECHFLNKCIALMLCLQMASCNFVSQSKKEEREFNISSGDCSDVLTLNGFHHITSRNVYDKSLEGLFEISTTENIHCIGGAVINNRICFAAIVGNQLPLKRIVFCGREGMLDHRELVRTRELE